MKTIILAAALALTSVSVNADNHSANKKVSVSVTNAFVKEFGSVEEVTWSNAANHMLRASFIQDDEKVNAFFNENGEFMASTIELAPEKLPSKLKAAINKKVKDAVITEAVQLQGDDQAYFVKVYVNGVEKVYKGSSLGALQLVNY